jgi:hypothetical protein
MPPWNSSKREMGSGSIELILPVKMKLVTFDPQLYEREKSDLEKFAIGQESKKKK